MSPLALLELPVGGLPAVKRLRELRSRPSRPALGQANAADTRLPLLLQLRLAKLHLAKWHVGEQLKRIGTGAEVVPDSNRHFAVLARGHLVGPNGGVP